MPSRGGIHDRVRHAYCSASRVVLSLKPVNLSPALETAKPTAADRPSLLEETQRDLARSLRADEVSFVHPTLSGWRCERWSECGGESRIVSEAELPKVPIGEGVGLLATEGPLLRIGLKFGSYAAWWSLVRKSIPFTEADGAAALARVKESAPLLALHDVLQSGQNAREQLDLILKHSADAIVVVDPENRIRLFNDAASEIFGYSQPEAIGMDYDMLLPPEARGKGEAEHIRHSVEQVGAVKDQESLRWSKDGKPLALKMTWAAIKKPEGSLVSRFSFIRDLRPIKKLREELVRAQSLAMVGELAASVAHEIRNPLASIMAAVENLRGELVPLESRDEMIRKILDQIRRLDDTVERLLVFAKPWEVSPREYDLAGLVQNVAAGMRRRPESEKIRIEVKADAVLLVFGDPELVEHVANNILRNGVQAAPAGGRVDVEVRGTETHVEIAVRDTGPGIPLEDQGKLFRPFFTTKSRGTGLGLATCQKMVQAHKGTIRIASAPGQGTEVVVKLPRSFR